MARCFFVCLPPILLAYLCCISAVSGDSHDLSCDSSEHRCWYNRYVTVSTRTTRRPWYCLWLCEREYIEYRLEKKKMCDCCPGRKMEGGVCRECDEGQYGMNCASVCSCEEGYHCDPVDGFCTCRKGVADASCQPLNSSCSGVGRGRLCSNMTCNYACVNGQKCNHHTNMCECPLDWRDDSGGTCNFLPGCPDGYFGPSCNQLCRCEHNATCDALGACECPAGWSGLTCGDPCEPWYYGSNCSRTCDCPEEALECSPIDGSCSCPQGFYGLNCSRECPDGYFGSNCRNVCSCDNLTETCDRLDGACKAKKGPPPSLAGPNPRDPGGRSSSATGAVIGSVIAGVVLVGLIVALVFFLQHRRKQGKGNRTDALSISPYVCYNTAAAAKDEYTELEERRYCGNTYAEAIDTFKSSPQHCIV